MPESSGRLTPIPTLIPAYGRDYRDASSAFADFASGKDFIFIEVTNRFNGHYASIRDMVPNGYSEVKFRFNRKTEFAHAEFDPASKSWRLTNTAD